MRKTILIMKSCLVVCGFAYRWGEEEVNSFFYFGFLFRRISVKSSKKYTKSLDILFGV